MWAVLLFSLALRLAVLVAILAFDGWLVFTVLERDLVGGLVVLLAIFLVGGIAFYIGGRIGWKQGRALKEYQQRLRAKRKAQEEAAEMAQNREE